MKKNKGFTLIELLAVIVILGVLLSISVVAVNKIKKKQDLENKLNVYSSVMTGVKNYIGDHPEFWDVSTMCAPSTNTDTCYSSSEYGYRLYTDKFWDLYVDFDKNKKDFKTIYYTPNSDGTASSTVRYALVKKCDLKYKVEFHFKADNGKTINIDDCGCERQYSYLNDVSSFKFCEADSSNWIEPSSTQDGKFTGWDSTGKYYICDINSTDSSNTETYMKANCNRPIKADGNEDTTSDLTLENLQ